MKAGVTRRSISWGSPDGRYYYWAPLPRISDPRWPVPAGQHPGRAFRRHLRALVREDRRTRRARTTGWPTGWVELGSINET